MENYINNYKNYTKTIIYNFRLGDGGLADYLKFFMIILTECMNKNIRLYHLINNIEIEKYIKFKYDLFDISLDEIIKLNNYSIKTPWDYYDNSSYKGNILLNEVFDFDDKVKMNVKYILPSVPSNYISIHLRMGDKFLETDKRYVPCKGDERKFTEENIWKFIENNSDKNIIFFCDNNSVKIKIKNKYKNVIITNAQIGHTSLSNTSQKQVLDTVTEFFLMTNSQLIYAASYSGFSSTASKFNNVEYIS